MVLPQGEAFQRSRSRIGQRNPLRVPSLERSRWLGGSGGLVQGTVEAQGAAGLEDTEHTSLPRGTHSDDRRVLERKDGGLRDVVPIQVEEADFAIGGENQRAAGNERGVAGSEVRGELDEFRGVEPANGGALSEKDEHTGSGEGRKRDQSDARAGQVGRFGGAMNMGETEAASETGGDDGFGDAQVQGVAGIDRIAGEQDVGGVQGSKEMPGPGEGGENGAVVSHVGGGHLGGTEVEGELLRRQPRGCPDGAWGEGGRVEGGKGPRRKMFVTRDGEGERSAVVEGGCEQKGPAEDGR